MNKKLFCIAVFAALSTSGYAFSVSAPKSYELQYLQSVGNINGFVQIPKGGQYDTTTEKRPTFDELNVKRVYYPELAFTAKWEKMSVTLQGKYESFKGKSNNLKQELVTHDIFLPEGSSIKTKHKYAYYGMNFNYDYSVTPNLTLTPRIGLTVLDFAYKFSAEDRDGNSIAKNDSRSFRTTMPTVGIKANYSLNEKTNLIFSMNSNLLSGRVRQYFDSSLLVSYNLYKNANQELNILGGIGYERLKFRDSQKDMQNYMKHSISPSYRVGLEYKF